MDYEKVELPVEKAVEIVDRKIIDERLKDLRLSKANELQMRNAQEGVMEELINRCVTHNATYSVEMLLNGQYRVAALSQNNWLGSGHTMFAKQINEKYITLFWNTIDEFFETLRNMGVRVEVSEKVSFGNNTILIYKTMFE